MFVLGSWAMSQYVDMGRRPSDVDIIGTYEQVDAYRKLIKPNVFYPISAGRKLFMKERNGRITEADIAWPGSVEEALLEFLKEQPDNLRDRNRAISVPSLDVLYMLKMSHRYLKNSPHFLKTMRDIQLLRRVGAKIRPEHQAFYEQRMKDTYVYSHPKLNQSKEGFFDAEATGVVYTHDHDSIHEAVRIHYQPAYMFFKPEDSEVLCDKTMFFNEPHNIQLCAVLEESCVLALERSLVPFPGGKTPKEAFDMALMKVCTSITSGWFREFAWENYDAVQGLYAAYEDVSGPDWYVNNFKAGLASGVVKPFNGATNDY